MENKEMFIYDIENFRVSITKCDTTAAGEIAVASEYNGYPVVFVNPFAFKGCSALEEIIIDKENPVFASVDGAWLNKEKTTLYWAPQGKAQTGYRVPECVEKIKHAFIGHGTLRSVAIPVTVNFIGAYSFEDCDALTDVYYAGTPEQWQAIDIEDGNECLQKATIHYNCHPDGEPKETLKPMIE